MATAATTTTTTSDSTAVDDASKQAPSGFVLKLFQMVNASDDEIIKVRVRAG